MKYSLLVTLLAISSAFGAGSISAAPQAATPRAVMIRRMHRTKSKLYAVLTIVAGPSRQFWNNNSSAWETYDANHWEQYAVPLTEGPKRNYSAPKPAGAAGPRSVVATYEQKGEEPVPGDKFAGNAEPDL